MKYINLNLKQIQLWSIALILLVLPFLSIKPADAAVNAQFSLTPASQSVQVGSDVVLDFDMNTGGNNVLAWKATINYSTSAFSSVVVTPTAGSHFSLNPGTDVASGGVIRLSRYALTSSSTNATLAKITLKSSGVGNQTVSFAHACSPTSDSTPCSAITDASGTNLISALNSGNVTVSALPVAATTQPKAKAKAKAKTVPKTPVEAVAAVAEAITEAVNPSSTKTESIRSAIKLTVTDQKNKPIEGAKVTLQGISDITNSRGEAIISELIPGNAKGQIVYKDQKQVINLIVDSGTSIDNPQAVKLTFQVKGSGISPLIIGLLALVLVTVIILFIRRRQGGNKEFVTIVPDKKKPHKGEVFKPVPAMASVKAVETIKEPIKKPEPKVEEAPKPEPKPEPKAEAIKEEIKVEPEIKPPPEPKVEEAPKPEPKPESKPTKMDSLKTKLGFIRHKPMDPGTIIRPDATK